MDKTTGKCPSLQTANKDEACQIVEAKNQAECQSVFNLQITKVYLAGTDNGITIRIWQQTIATFADTKQGANQHRWSIAAKRNAFGRLIGPFFPATDGAVVEKLVE